MRDPAKLSFLPLICGKSVLSAFEWNPTVTVYQISVYHVNSDTQEALLNNWFETLSRSFVICMCIYIYIDTTNVEAMWYALITPTHGAVEQLSVEPLSSSQGEHGVVFPLVQIMSQSTSSVQRFCVLRLQFMLHPERVSVALHKCLPLDKHTRRNFNSPRARREQVCRIESNGILILRKTFENNYSNGCLPVESRNPTVKHSSKHSAAWPQLN